MAFSHGKNATVYCNGYVLTGYLNQFAATGAAEAAETTVFQKNSKTYIPGLIDASLSAEGLFDGTADASDAILSAALGASANSIWTWFPARSTTLGDDGYGFSAIETGYEVASPVSGVVTVGATAQGTTGMEAVKVLQPLAALTATGNGSALDNTAGTTNGGAGYLHVTAVSGTATPTLTVTLEHSTDNAIWTTLGTFAAVTAANQAERIAVTGTVNQYVRAARTITGTTPSITAVVAFNRK